MIVEPGNVRSWVEAATVITHGGVVVGGRRAGAVVPRARRHDDTRRVGIEEGQLLDGVGARAPSPPEME